MELAPIVLFVYNRPDHTRQTVEALQKNFLAKDSELFVFSDAPKNEAATSGVAEVRKYLYTISGFKKVSVIERVENWGLAKSIIQGVTEIVKKYGRVIVLEDDLVTSSHFLEFMNQGLEVYKDDAKAMEISGYCYPIKGDLPETFFFKQMTCWGWATWARAWKYFNPDAKQLLGEIRSRNLLGEFNIDGVFNFSSQLDANIAGRIKTWAIKWYASAFLQGGLALYPAKSLVQNIGHDNTGVHSTQTHEFEIANLAAKVEIVRQPVVENPGAVLAIKAFLRSIKPSLFQKIKNRLGFK